MKIRPFGSAGVLCAIGIIIGSGFSGPPTIRVHGPSRPTGEYVPVVVTTTSSGGSDGTYRLLDKIDDCLAKECSNGSGRKSHKTRDLAPGYKLAVGETATFTVDWHNDFNDHINDVHWKAFLVQSDQCTRLALRNNGYIDLDYSWMGDDHEKESKVSLTHALPNGAFIFLIADVGNACEDCHENGVVIFSK